MARLRTIKPGFFLDDELAECRPLSRLLFAGLWTIADREGRLKDRPRKIKAETLPYDDCDVNELLHDLATHGSPARFIIRYSVDECPYIAIPSWDKHQSPHVKEAPSTIPAPDEYQTSMVLEQNLNPRSCLGSCLGSGILVVGSGKDQVPSAAENPAAPQKKSVKVKAPKIDDFAERAAELLERSSFPSDLLQLSEIMAAENKSGQVSMSRVVRELYAPLVEMESEFSQEAMRHGLRAALSCQAPNANYVKKAAAKFKPGGNSNSRRDTASALDTLQGVYDSYGEEIP